MKIIKKTNEAMFSRKKFSTSRRFNDFIDIYERLKEKHLPAGRILPPVPDDKHLTSHRPAEFIDKRRAALQRFLMRLTKHNSFRNDPDFRDFLEIPDHWPNRANNKLGIGMMQIMYQIVYGTDSNTKTVFKMDETDLVYTIIIYF
jgi:hypothetical protein